MSKPTFVYTLQLSNDIFVDIGVGDLFVYKFKDNYCVIEEVTQDFTPCVNEFAVEIISFYSRRHFVFYRKDGAYWWSEVNF